MNTNANYRKVMTGIYSYNRVNGKKTYRARKTVGGRMITHTFHLLREAKAWLTSNATFVPAQVLTRNPRNKKTKLKFRLPASV